MTLRSIPPRTSTGTSPIDIGKRFSKIASKTKRMKILSGVRGRILGRSFNLGNPEAFNFGMRSIKRQQTKIGKVHKKIRSPMVKIEKKSVTIDKFDEKDKFEIIVEGTNQYTLKDDILSVGELDEILLPKNIKLDTLKAEEKNGVLVITFKKRIKRKKKK